MMSGRHPTWKEEEKMTCPKCHSLNVDPTCHGWKAGEEPNWTGYYCYDCGHWWKEEES